MSRDYTGRLVRMIDDGLVSADAVVLMCLSYMSEDDVEDMMRANDLMPDEDEDDE